MRPVAKWLDQKLWSVLEKTVGFLVPRVTEGRGWDCVVSVPGREDMTYQEWLVRQPIKMGGMGLRSLVDTSLVAYLGAIEVAIPSFTGEGGICKLFTKVVDGDECWGRDALSE